MVLPFLLLLLLLTNFVFLLITTADAQFPFIDPGDSSSVGQCMSNTDCDVYLSLFPGAQPGSINCYEPYMQCISPITGKILGPAFDIQCDPSVVQISNIIAYPSVLCTPNSNPRTGDGIIKVTLQANPVQRLKGIIRLYTGTYNPPFTNDTFALNYISQIYTNYPQTVYYFNQLLVGTYTVIYFDITGCWSFFPPLTIVNAYSQMQFTAAPCGSSTGFLSGLLNILNYWYVDTATPRALRVGILNAVCSTYVVTTPGTSRRSIVANIFDAAGTLVASYKEADMCINTNGTGGATIPVSSRLLSTYYSSTLSQSWNAGYQIISAGLGYVYYPIGGGPGQFLYNDDGSFRGTFLAPYVVNMTNTGYGKPPGTISSVPPYFVLGGVFTNTQIMYVAPSYFYGFDLSSYPVISVHTPNPTNFTQSTYSACFGPVQGGGTTTYAIVSADYTQLFPAKSSSVELLMMVNGTLKSFSPPQVTGNAIQPVQFRIYQTGTYCIAFTGKALDSYPTRVLLYSCFFVGRPTSWLMQTSSVLADTPYTPVGSPLAFATFLNTVQTTFILGMPAVFFSYTNMDPRVVLLLSSNDTLYQSQLNAIGVGSFNVFNDQKGSWSVSSFYNTQQLAGMTLYTVNVNLETNGEVVVNTVEGDVVLGETAISQFQLVNSSDFDYYDVTENTQYSCNVVTFLSMMELYSLSIAVSVNEPICPDQLTVLGLYAEGGVCYHMTNPIYLETNTSTNGGLDNPFVQPCGYFFQVQNYDPTSPGYLNILAAELGLATYNAPTNTILRIIAYDASDNVVYAIAKGESLVPPSTTIVNFVSQDLFCDNGTQYTNITFEVITSAPVNESEIITYWVPTDLTINELYDPNDLYFDLPIDCPLLRNMTAYEVQYYCTVDPYGISTDDCLLYCNQLPPAYPFVNGQSLVYGIDGAYWDAVAWVPSPYFNNDTGRYIYCRTGNSIRTDIPTALQLQYTGPELIYENYGTYEQACSGNNCYKITTYVVVDTIYKDIIQNITVQANPPFGKSPYANPKLEANQYSVNLAVQYEVSIDAKGMCPSSYPYEFNIVGPLIININVYDSMCNVQDGAVNMVMYYYGDTTANNANTVNLCFYMPNFNGAPLPFQAPVNAEFYLPTTGLGFNQQYFDNMPPGLTDVWIYQSCNNPEGPGNNCFSCVTLPPDGAFVIEPEYLQVHRQFFLPTMGSQGGGLTIVNNGYNEAQCYGDTYSFSFSIYDDAGPNGQGYPPYVVQFVNPLGVILKTFGCCQNTILFPNCTGELPPAKPVGGGRVFLAEFNFTLDTGSTFGFQPNGNYTFVVKSCNSSCTKGYPIYIDMVNPIIINLASEPQTCNSDLPFLTFTVNGGAGYYSSNPAVNITYVNPYNGLIYSLPYIICWYTPFNPTDCEQMYLPPNVVPGLYTLCATDRNGCQACQSINVTNIPPITVQLLGYDEYCQTSTSAVATFNISGPNPPFYIMEFLDQVSNGSLINITVYQNYSNSLCFRVMDSVGCITTRKYCFVPPAALPVNFTIDSIASCPSPLAPTGFLEVVPNENYTCSWAASGIPINNYDQCYQRNVPPGTDYVVTVSNFAGCSTTSAPVAVAARSPIFLTLLNRTLDGTLYGPCIDVIVAYAAGGTYTPPYCVSVSPFDPETMNVTIEGGHTIFVTGVCRGEVYILSVADSDCMCAMLLKSTDPFYDTGGSATNIPPLSLPNNDFFPKEQKGAQGSALSVQEASVISIGIAVGLVILIAVACVVAQRTKEPDRN